MSSDESKDQAAPLAEFPELPAFADAGLVALKAATSLFVPGADLLDLLRLPIQKRQAGWLNDVAEHLKRLEAEERLSVEDVVNNPRFMDAVVAGLESVKGSREKDKRDALRNAVLNAALGTSGDDAQQDIFMRLIDRFTVWHVRFLKVFADPVAWATGNGMEGGRAGHSTDSFFRAAVPDIGLPYCKLVWRDLHRAGLVNADESSMFATMSNTPSWRRKLASDLGRDFLRFIEEPPVALEQGPPV